MKLEFVRQKLNIYRTTLRAKHLPEREIEVYIEKDDGTLKKVDKVKLIQDGVNFYIALK